MLMEHCMLTANTSQSYAQLSGTSVDEFPIMSEDGTADRSRLEHDPESGTYRITYSDRENPPSIVIPEAIATITDVDVLELDPLSETIDPDALDRLFWPRPCGVARGGGSVEFTYHGVRVSIWSYGVIEFQSTTSVESS